MTIWILAVLLIGGVALAGWRQGVIRASFSFVGILFAALLAPLVGKLFHLLLPHLGVSDPIIVWALSPLLGFIVVTIPFKIAGFAVHRKVDTYYKYKAGDLQLALWERLNLRLGICVGIFNGTAYFVLVCFVIFNLTYVTTQVESNTQKQPVLLRLANNLGRDLQATGFSRAAAGVATLQPMYYRLADLAGFLAQNPQTAGRLADYPALTPLWERSDMQPLVQDNALTNALASGATLGKVLGDPTVTGFLKNKTLTHLVLGILQTNMNDLTNYLQTGKSPKYDGQKILGHWDLNVGVTLAWLRQGNPRIQASEMRAIRALWLHAYGKTILLMTPDKQVFVKNLPRFKAQPQQGQPPFQLENYKGDWSQDDSKNYTLHVTINGEDKYWAAIIASDGLRLSVKDGRNLLIFDHID